MVKTVTVRDLVEVLLHVPRRARHRTDLDTTEMCAMSEAITVGGEFWVPTMPDVRVRGEYSDEPWRVPRRLPIAPRGTRVLTRSGPE